MNKQVKDEFPIDSIVKITSGPYAGLYGKVVKYHAHHKGYARIIFLTGSWSGRGFWVANSDNYPSIPKAQLVSK